MAESKPSKKEALAAHLRKAVLTLELAPGAELDEMQLCKAHGLSRTPLREVFRDLAGEGYLSLRSHRSVRVSELSHTTLRSFFQAAPMVYSAILQLAAQHASAPQIAALKEAQEAFRETLRKSDVGARALANNRFHEITGEMADNPYLAPSFHRLLIDHARISMTFYNPRGAQMMENLDTANHHHDAIIEAIEARDAPRAAQLALDHWALSRSQIEMFVMPAGLDAPLGQIRNERSA